MRLTIHAANASGGGVSISGTSKSALSPVSPLNGHRLRMIEVSPIDPDVKLCLGTNHLLQHGLQHQKAGLMEKSLFTSVDTGDMETMWTN